MDRLHRRGQVEDPSLTVSTATASNETPFASSARPAVLKVAPVVSTSSRRITARLRLLLSALAETTKLPAGSERRARPLWPACAREWICPRSASDSPPRCFATTGASRSESAVPWIQRLFHDLGTGTTSVSGGGARSMAIRSARAIASGGMRSSRWRHLASRSSLRSVPWWSASLDSAAGGAHVQVGQPTAGCCSCLRQRPQGGSGAGRSARQSRHRGSPSTGRHRQQMHTGGRSRWRHARRTGRMPLSTTDEKADRPSAAGGWGGRTHSGGLSFAAVAV